MFIRRFVSGDRRRFIDDKYDLDLTYITDRIIAMSFPATGFNELFRNPRKRVKEFLDEFHKDSYLVFNLCNEVQGQYEPKDFANASNPEGAVRVPFENHSVPTLLQAAEFCQAAIKWLERDSGAVVVVHCMAGKGRTGLMVSSLLSAIQGISAEDALSQFAQKRSVGCLGVTVPMQRQFVDTFVHVLRVTSDQDDTPSVRLMKTFQSVMTSSHPKLRVVAITFSEDLSNIVRAIKFLFRNGNRIKFPTHSLTACTSGFLLEGGVIVNENFSVTVKLQDGSKLSAWFCVENPLYQGESTFTIENALVATEGDANSLKICLRFVTNTD